MSNLLKTKVEAAKALVASSQDEYLKKAQEEVAKVAYDAVLEGKGSIGFPLTSKATGLNPEYRGRLIEWAKESGFKVSTHDEKGNEKLFVDFLNA